MLIPQPTDPTFRQALAALDSGDVATLSLLLEEHPRLVRERIAGGEGYFANPYLLWFVAENPIRSGSLPANIGEITRVLVNALRSHAVDSLSEQVDYALALVCSGRVARECGAQRELIDVLIEAGAAPEGAMLPALAHRELEAVAQLLDRGATLTLPAALALGRDDDVARLAAIASPEERQLGLTVAAFYGQPRSLTLLIGLGVDLDAFSPAGFHAHATPLHQAVDSGCLEAVEVLVEAGADRSSRDRLFQGTPLDWAQHLERAEIASFLQQKESSP